MEVGHMSDTKQANRQIQILYTFVASYETLTKTVKEMALSGDPANYVKAEAICNIIADFVYDISEVSTLVEALNKLVIEPKLKPLRDNLIDQLQKNEGTILVVMTSNYQKLIDILLLRDTIRPSTAPVLDEDEQALYQFTKNPIIKVDPGQPIASGDLLVLNEIASANVSKKRTLSDYSKQFRKPETRAAIKRLYYEASYYFEQAFSNADVSIQGLLLEAVREDIKKSNNDQVKAKALEDLEDLHILATIDTSANKMTSKVSDHQAFELFLSALVKNNNDYIIRKLVNDDIIMDTLFNISTRDKDNYYGFRRMFTMARHPYDALILNKYIKIRKLGLDRFKAIVQDLSRDAMFKASYENFLKTEKTISFIATIDEIKLELQQPTINHELLYKICMVIEEFTDLEVYNDDILTTDFVMNFVTAVYTYMITNNTFGKDELIEKSLEKFFDYRVRHMLTSTRTTAASFGGDDTFGITPSDVWYECHRLIHRYKIQGVHSIVLRYAKEESYRFEVGGLLESLQVSDGQDRLKKLAKSQLSFNCFNIEGTGFEHYVFNLYGRMVKGLMATSIVTTLASVKTTTFRKIQVPGISVNDDKNLRKAIINYMTLKYLWEKNPKLFLHIYKTRANGILRAINAIEKSPAQMKPFLEMHTNAWVLGLFNKNATVAKLSDELDKLSRGGRDQLYVSNAEAFFQLAQESS